MSCKKLKFYFTLLVTFIPVFAFAQLGQINMLLQSAKNIITQILIPLVFALALLVFFYGIVKYIWSTGTEKEQGKKIMVWGVIALFVMSSIWGLVRFLREQLTIGDESSVPIPTIGG